jgi:hypothetical protein
MNAWPVGVRKVVAWGIIVVAWAMTLPLGVVCALALPLNLLLVPCFLAIGSCLGRLPEVLLDGIPSEPLREGSKAPLNVGALVTSARAR